MARWVETSEGSRVNLDQAEVLVVEEIPGTSEFRLIAKMASHELVVLGSYPDRVEAEIELHRVAQEVDARGSQG